MPPQFTSLSCGFSRFQNYISDINLVSCIKYRSETIFWKKATLLRVFPCGSDGNKSAYNAGDPSSVSGLGRCPGGGHGNPLQYPCLKNAHGKRSLKGFSPWGHTESDMTKQRTHTHTHTHTHTSADK